MMLHKIVTLKYCTGPQDTSLLHRTVAENIKYGRLMRLKQRFNLLSKKPKAEKNLFHN